MGLIGKVGVIGAGLMGSGIAQVVAQAGCEVVMVDVENKFLERGFDAIRQSLGLMQKKGKITTEEVTNVLERIRGTLELTEAAKDADLIIEVIPENLEQKRHLFAELDKI